MSTGLAVDGQNKLSEWRETGRPNQPAVVRLLAKIISYIFHPVFIPVYIILFLNWTLPILLAGFTPVRKMQFIVQSVLNYTFFPIVTVLLLKALNFIQSIYLKTQKDRIIPFIICGIYYFWTWYVLRNLPEFSREFVILAMAVWIASSIGLLANIYMKVSMHAMSMGLLVTFMLLLAKIYGAGFGLYTSVAILLTGIVCTARLIVSDHTQKEIYVGLLIGALSQLIAHIAW